MANHWIFQANPKLYEIDRALTELSEILWRAPQYTGAISVGDGVAIWRSGPESGVVGVGRVKALPREMPPVDSEAQYELDPSDGLVESRVPVAVVPTPYVAKATVEALPTWAGHPIVVAPMGTVFPVSPQQWAELQPLIAALPTPMLDSAPQLTPVLAWEQRGKDAYPMPGGYDGYLRSLKIVATAVEQGPPNRSGLEQLMRSQFGSSETNARFGVGFLLRIGALVERGDLIELGDATRTWLVSGNPDYVIALLHSRVRFVGEMLHAAREPRTINELLRTANEGFGTKWSTTAQILRRRGWLQSAGMLEDVNGDRVKTTDRGRQLLSVLSVKEPWTAPRAAEPEGTSTVPTITPPATPIGAVEDKSAPISSVEQLITRLDESGRDGNRHEQFEIEAAEAFRRLGFNAQWLGKAGRTDVLLEAELGRGASYRVIVDCKSTGRGTVSNQIDWDTIDEHRALHQADYAVVLAPDFGGGRLSGRAANHRTVLLKIDDLAELLRLHEQTPLTLDDYRRIFTTEDANNPTAVVAEIAEEAGRRLEIAAAIVELLTARGARMGPMTARDFFGALIDRDDLPDATSAEIEEIVLVLSSPLVRLLERDEHGAVRFATSPATGAAMLQRLADAVSPGKASAV